MPNIHILFTGICTLIHRRNVGPTAVEVPLLLHERTSTVTGEPIPPHEAFLVTSADYDIIDESGREYTTASYDGKQYRITYLDDDELSVRSASGKVRVNETPASGPCQGEDIDNLYWVPRISALLQSNHAEQGVPLAARVKLAGGSMHAYVVNRYVWDFKQTASGPAYHTQAMAQIVSWDFSMGGAVMIDFDQSGKRYLSIRSGTEPIVIVMGSAPDIVAAVSRTMDHDHDTDPHFETYYDRVADDHPIYIPFKNNDVQCSVYPPPLVDA